MTYDSSPVLSGLTDFQRATVEHVTQRFWGERPTDRFLVADQTGLGKTMVARGMIARAVERLQHDPDVHRIDVVYVCSNADLARQNLHKLTIPGATAPGVASRLSLLGRHVKDFAAPVAGGPKPLNIVSFTPGTSFEPGWRSGWAEERAMVQLVLEHAEELDLTHPDNREAAYEVLRGGVRSVDRFRAHVDSLRRELDGKIDDKVVDLPIEAFLASARGEGSGGSLIDRFRGELERARAGKDPVSWHGRQQLLADLRNTLGRVSVQLLTPDLVILDEFQRFRDLLDPQTPAGELAHHLFDFRHPRGNRTKVLLLSATPYKPFTYAEEAATGDDHQQDFLKVVRFLGDGDPTDPAGRVAHSLRAYRESLVRGEVDPAVTDAVRRDLLDVMVRTERPSAEDVQMAREVRGEPPAPTVEDVRGFVALRRVARHAGSRLPVDYWKAAPYFVNFMDGYDLGRKVRAALEDGDAELAALLQQTQRLRREDVEQQRPIDLGNPRLRLLAEQTVGTGWWRLLWVPPSLPYLEPGGPYADPALATMTKRLVFSSWAATPTAVAALLSYEADRLVAGQRANGPHPTNPAAERLNLAKRLFIGWDSAKEAPRGLSTMALFLPVPGLADAADPRALRREGCSSPADARDRAAARLSGVSRQAWVDGEQSAHAQVVATAIGEGLDADDLVRAFSSPADEQEQSGDDDLPESGLRRAAESIVRRARVAASDDDLDEVADIGLHSPGNIAWRALGRVASAEATQEGRWRAAAYLADGIRSLFRRPETVMLVDQLVPETQHYWQRVLRYCAWGNLQAVLDEYVHHLAAARGQAALDDDGLIEIAGKANEVLTLRSTQYQWFDPDGPDAPPPFPVRFALRYGGRSDNQESQRQPQVRDAFNSPFQPFVLASTSVGQEGIDFHWWCHSLLHWNTPANPVDFEQREGRIDRYDGHAVRRNIAADVGDAALAAEDDDVWDAAYRLAGEKRAGTFTPHWVYTGAARIERHVAPLPLSTDVTRLERVKRDVALYRLTFGQPRQEDLLELLKAHQVSGKDLPLDAARIDLAAPRAKKTPEARSGAPTGERELGHQAS